MTDTPKHSTTVTPKDIEAMREHLLDCRSVATEDSEAVIRSVAPEAILAYVTTHYDGGIAQFLKDSR